MCCRTSGEVGVFFSAPVCLVEALSEVEGQGQKGEDTLPGWYMERRRQTSYGSWQVAPLAALFLPVSCVHFRRRRSRRRKEKKNLSWNEKVKGAQLGIKAAFRFFCIASALESLFDFRMQYWHHCLCEVKRPRVRKQKAKTTMISRLNPLIKLK